MLTQTFAQVLFFFYSHLGNNLGLAIIVLTIILKALLFPITLSSLRAAEKLKKIQPEIDELKKKHKDPKKLQQAQIELFKKHKVNPIASFVPQIIQIIVFIMLYRLLSGFLGAGEVNGEVINTQLLWMDLTKPDHLYILPILTALSQFTLSYLMQKKPKTLKKKQTDKKENQSMMAGMSKTMIYVMPLITGFFALKFPSGLVLYWITSNLFSLGQQVYLIKTQDEEEKKIELEVEKEIEKELKEFVSDNKNDKQVKPKKRNLKKHKKHSKKSLKKKGKNERVR